MLGKTNFLLTVFPVLDYSRINYFRTFFVLEYLYLDALTANHLKVMFHNELYASPGKTDKRVKLVSGTTASDIFQSH